MATASTQVMPSGAFVRVETLRVDVFVPAGEVSASIFRDPELVDWTGPQREASPILWHAKELAERVLEQLLEWVRTAGNQWWLGLAGSPPEAVGQGMLVDVAEWARIPVTIGLESLVFRQVNPQQILRTDRLQRLADRTASGALPSLALSVLADSAFYAYDAEPRDPTRAVLTAAMAVELKVKQSLADGAKDPSVTSSSFSSKARATIPWLPTHCSMSRFESCEARLYE